MDLLNALLRLTLLREALLSLWYSMNRVGKLYVDPIGMEESRTYHCKEITSE